MAIRHRPPTHMIASAFIQNLELRDDGIFRDPIQIDLRAGETVVIVGPNGVGKSALIEEIGRYLRNASDIELFSGYRQIHFQSDDVDQVGQSLATFKAQLSHPQVNRMRNPWGEQHLRSVVRRLINRQHQDNDEFVADIRAGLPLEDASVKHALVLDELNGVFEAARLEVRVLLTEGSLKATKGNNIYGLDRMSDGERSALLVAGAILVRPTDGRIAIDEPERHLNPAISGPLIAAAMRARPDVGYLFATHDLNLLSWLLPNQVIHVSSSDVIHAEPEVRRYKIEQVGNTQLPTENLKTAVFGSRKALLLVEGTELSSDEALFGLMYKDRNVIGRGGWESVVAEVRGLNRNGDLHWLNTFGIIDGDGRDDEEVNKLKDDEIYCLPCPSIENLFFNRETVIEMISLQHNLKGGSSPDERLAVYEQVARAASEAAKSQMIFRRSTWRTNRELAARKISVKDIREGQSKIEEIDIEPIKADVGRQVEEALANTDVHVALMHLPIKNTGIPAALSKEIGFDSFSSYKQAILHQIQAGSKSGVIIIKALTAILPILPPI